MMIILYTSISIVFLAFILCLIIRFNNNRKENIKNTVKQAFWNDCNKHSLLLFHLMVDKLNVQESDLPKKNYEHGYFLLLHRRRSGVVSLPLSCRK